MDPERSKKIFLMKVGVTAIVIIIVAAWSINLKNVWLTEGRLAADPSNDQAWSGLKTDLEKVLADTENNLAGLQERTKRDEADKSAFLDDVLAGAQKIASTTDEASSSPVFSATSSPVSTSSPATTTPVNIPAVKPGSRCPEYIDCMPTVGAPRPCQVPAGCEGITTIAY
jgi:hypothetical protein